MGSSTGTLWCHCTTLCSLMCLCSLTCLCSLLLFFGGMLNGIKRAAESSSVSEELAMTSLRSHEVFVVPRTVASPQHHARLAVQREIQIMQSVESRVAALHSLRAALEQACRPFGLSHKRFDETHELFERSSNQQQLILEWLGDLISSHYASLDPLTDS